MKTPFRAFMKLPFHTRLVISLLSVLIIPGLTATIVGVRLLTGSVSGQAQNKVRLDLNTAREIYNEHINDMRTIFEYTAIRPSLWASVARGNTALLKERIMGVYERSGLDVLNVTDKNLRVVYRCGNPLAYGDFQGSNPIVAKAWETGQPVGSTQIVPRRELLREKEELAERAFFKIIPTPKAGPIDQTESTAGMMIMAAAPLLDDSGRRVGVIYGGSLINRDYRIVDKIKDIVFKGEKYKERDIGTSTIFQGNVRASTNVLTADGERAIGTRVSSEVYNQVLVRGRRWIDRAFVVNSWYITAYEPIEDVDGKAIGMLYVGILEKPYAILKWKIIGVFLLIAGIGLALAVVISYFLTQSILGPIGELSAGAEKLARGEFDYRIPVRSRDEIGELCQAFNSMAESLLDRDRQLWENTQHQLTQSEKLATIGRLTAGVAHELNNPLTGVMTFSNLLLQDYDLPQRVKDDLQVVVAETSRCRGIIRNLLDFARETRPEIVQVSINELIESALNIVRKQNLFQNIEIEERLRPDLPEIAADPNQIKQVIVNLVLNASEAMPGGGRLTIATNYGADRRFVKISVHDNGIGIPKEDLKSIFEPFFTTKGKAKGTGMGLAVSYGIVQKHKGMITVSSHVDEGTTFEINLPLRQS